MRVAYWHGTKQDWLWEEFDLTNMKKWVKSLTLYKDNLETVWTKWFDKEEWLVCSLEFETNSQAFHFEAQEGGVFTLTIHKRGLALDYKSIDREFTIKELIDLFEKVDRLNKLDEAMCLAT